MDRRADGEAVTGGLRLSMRWLDRFGELASIASIPNDAAPKRHPRIAPQFSLALVAVIAVLLPMTTTSTSAAPLIVAHRGASHDAPENTLASFKLAWEQGADGIEGDFRLTKDGRIVCVHDKDMKRTAGDPRKVADMAFDEVRKFDVGSWKNKKFSSERPPTLIEVLATVPKGKKAFVELKSGPEFIGPLKKELAESKIDRKQIIVIAFDDKAIAECKRQMPEVRCHWLTGFQLQANGWTPTADHVLKTAARCRADGVGFKGNRGVVDTKFLRVCGASEYHFWTIDKPADAAYFQKLGAFGITTNRPGWLREQLQNRDP